MVGKINKTKIISSAQKYVHKGQYDRAIREYLKIVEHDSRDVRIWLKIGDLYAKKGATKEAIETYLKVAAFYSEQGFYLKAVAVYKQVLKIDPEFIEINLKLAELYKQLGLLSDAMQQYELVSNHYNAAGRSKDALAAVRQMVDLDPENVASRIKLAELYSKEDMTGEAIAEFGKAVDFLRAHQRIDDFVKVAERLIYHQPDNARIAKELAGLYLRRRDPRRALQKLQIAFGTDARDEETLEMLAQAFEDLGQTQKTVSVLKELAQIRTESGQGDAGLDTYRRVLELAPNDAEALSATQDRPRAAEAREVQREPAEPVLAEDSSLKSTGGQSDSEGKASLSADSLVTGRVDVGEGQQRAQQRMVIEDGEDVNEAINRVLSETEVYAKYGLYEKALEHLKQVFVWDPDNVAVRQRLRDIYVKLERFEEAGLELFALAKKLAASDPAKAADYLKQALELDPNNGPAQLMLAELSGEPVVSRRAPQPEQRDTSSSEYSAIELDAADIEEIPVDDVAVLSEAAGNEALDVLAAEIEFDATSEGHAIDSAEFEEEALDSVMTIDGTNNRQYDHTTPQTTGQNEPISNARLDEDLEEAEFFLQQNLFVEARAILEELDAQFPNHPLVRAKLADLSATAPSTPAAGIDDAQADEERVDLLAAELAAALDSVAPGEQTDDHDFSVEDVLSDARGVSEEQVGDADYDTHYDLGIAYREMGLLDEAISEFKVAMRSREKEVLCHMMIGLCYAEKGMVAEAINQFKTGLYVEGITEREMIALYFELGQSYEKLGDFSEALYYFEKVVKKDPNFREVGERIEKVKQLVDEKDKGGNGSGGGGLAHGTTSNRSSVSGGVDRSDLVGAS